jgi:hypothetical protein
MPEILTTVKIKDTLRFTGLHYPYRPSDSSKNFSPKAKLIKEVKERRASNDVIQREFKKGTNWTLKGS